MEYNIGDIVRLKPFGGNPIHHHWCYAHTWTST